MKHSDIQDFRAVGRRLRNWGRWGPDDERGTLNLITPERLVAAGLTIKQGKVFDLGIPFDRDGPQGNSFRINPVRLMSEVNTDMARGAFRFNDDYVFMPLQAATHWDALAHVSYDDQLYNGFPAASVTAHGAERDAIDKAKAICGRGVLLDIARLKGVEWMAAGEVITSDDLDAAAARQSVQVGPGDIVMVRTGWWGKYLADRDRAGFVAGEPGLGMACCEWLYDRDVAAVCADNFGVEVMPGEYETELFPLHLVLLRDMGMMFGELLDLEVLAADCAADGVYECFLSAPPIAFTGALGSPINPLAIK
jgi:kynurenine formamidase